MKRMLPTTQYTFSVGGNLIDFSTYPEFDPKRVLAVINTSIGQTLIFATGGGPLSSTGGTFYGSIGAYYLNLTFNCGAAGMTDADILQIIYDESVGTEEAKSSIDIVSGKSGLDVNLLNSSFGGTVGDIMPAPFQDNALSIGILNGGVLESPAMNINNELIVDVTQSGSVPVAVGGVVSVDINSYASNAISVSTPFPATPTNPATGAFQSFGAGATDANTQRVTANINQISDLFFTGSPQSTIQNNIITGSSVATDCLGYRSFSAQLVVSATSGLLFFEGSNDNSNFVSIPVINQSVVNGLTIVTSIGASVGTIIYSGALNFRYLRIRIGTALSGGTATAHVKLSPISFVPVVQTVSNSTASNLNATVAGTVTATVAAATLNAATVVDIASAAITTTATSGTLSLTNNGSVAFYYNVTAISGVSASIDVSLEETFDGVNWFKFYDFPRITSVGQYYTPLMRFTGVSYRVVRTISGTTPSVTSSLTRKTTQISASVNKLFISRTIDPNAIASSTNAFLIDGCSTINLCASMGAGGSGTPTFKLQGSEDQVLWFDLGTTTVAVAPSSAGVATYSGYISRFVRAQVTTAGSGTTLGQVCIKGNGV